MSRGAADAFADREALNGPKMTPERLAAYLDRIGLAGPVPLTLEGLTAVQQAHQWSVPFENLDIMAGRPLSLDHDALFRKIVERRQGGVCAELNTAYNWLLYSLGFRVTSYSARVCYPKPFIQFRRHRVIGVALEGRTYAADAGTNLEYARVPLLLEDGLVQTDGFAEYRLSRHPFFGWLQEQRRPGEADWHVQIGFTEEPQIDVDFITPMFYYEKHPGSNMNLFPRVSRYTKDAFLAIRNHTFLVERVDVCRKATPLPDWEEEKRLIREVFGLDTTGIDGT